MLILYVETNLIMSIAKGRDKEAEEMLKNPPTGVDFMMPSLCYMEAIFALENERKQKTEFLNNITIQINEESRKFAEEPSELFTNLQTAKLSYEQSLSAFKQSFIDALSLVCERVNLIEFQKDSIIKSFNQPILIKDKQVRDNLILQCILDHAQQALTIPKVLLTENSQEFGKPEVRSFLTQVGITKYFTNTTSFLGWLNNK